MSETRGSLSRASHLVIAAAALSLTVVAPAAVTGQDAAPPIPKVYNGNRMLQFDFPETGDLMKLALTGR